MTRRKQGDGGRTEGVNETEEWHLWMSESDYRRASTPWEVTPRVIWLVRFLPLPPFLSPPQARLEEEL